MGNFLPAQTPPLSQRRTTSNKKRSFVEEDSHTNLVVKAKKRKTNTTSLYIYNQLFQNGEGSDITVKALKKEWKLHKVYLKQALYFRTMFSGDWKEKDQKEIELIVPDSKITREALDTAFGYLYSDIIEVDQSTAESVLAAASLIQFEGLMQACSQVMLETVSSKNVSKFYESSRLYGQQIVENNCVTWLENNIMLQAMRGTHIGIENELMIRILSSSKLFVIQVIVCDNCLNNLNSNKNAIHSE